MADSRIFFVCSNGNHAKMFKGVAELFQAAGQSCGFLSLDNYYHQGAERELAGEGYFTYQLPCSEPLEDWWAVGAEEQKPLVREAWREFDKFFFEHRPVAIVLGIDYGWIEQVCLRTAEAYDVKTVFLQDGLSHIFNWLRPEQRGEPVRLGDAGAELFCVWSDMMTFGNRHRRVGSRFAVTGSSKYDCLASWEKKPAKKPYKVLLALQCFSKYGSVVGAVTPGQEVAMYDHLIRKLLQRDDVEVLLKLHPQTTMPEAYYEMVAEYGDKVEVTEIKESLEVLKTVDAVITITSTVSIEAAMMGIPTRRVTALTDIRCPEHYRRYWKDFQEQILSENFPESLSQEHGKRGEFYQEYMREVDGNAAKRITEEVHSLLDATPVVSETVNISVVMEVRKPLTARNIRAVLRNLTPAIALVLIDHTPARNLEEVLRPVISDPRLRFVRGDESSPTVSLKKALSQCRSEIVLRIDENVTLMPGALDHIYDYFLKRDEKRVVFSYFGYRNEVSVIEQLQKTDEHYSFSQLLTDEIGAALVSCYSFRANAPALIESLSGVTEQLDLHIIQHLSGGREETKKIGVFPGVLYFTQETPFADRSLLEPVSEEQVSTSEIVQAQGEERNTIPEVSLIKQFSDERIAVESLLNELERCESHLELICSAESTEQLSKLKERVEGTCVPSSDSEFEMFNTLFRASRGEYAFLWTGSSFSAEELALHMKIHGSSGEKPVMVLSGARQAVNGCAELLSQPITEENCRSLSELDVNYSLARDWLVGAGLWFDDRQESSVLGQLEWLQRIAMYGAHFELLILE